MNNFRHYLCTNERAARDRKSCNAPKKTRKTTSMCRDSVRLLYQFRLANTFIAVRPISCQRLDDRSVPVFAVRLRRRTLLYVFICVSTNWRFIWWQLASERCLARANLSKTFSRNKICNTNSLFSRRCRWWTSTYFFFFLPLHSHYFSRPLFCSLATLSESCRQQFFIFLNAQLLFTEWMSRILASI